MDYKISRDVAEDELERFAEAFDLDMSDDFLPEEDAQQMNKNKLKLLKNIMKGSLIINEDGEPVFTSKDGEKIHFKSFSPQNLIQVQKGKKTSDMEHLFFIMHKMTGQKIEIFSQMKMSDFNVCVSITTLFLG